MKKILFSCQIILLLTYQLHAQNVGIGTPAPEAKLHIKGNADASQLIIDANAKQSSTQPLIRLRNVFGTDLMHIHSNNISNVFIGLNAGRNSSGSAGLANTFIGSVSGYSNITGSFNTAIGYDSLYSNTTAGKNTAIGNGALYYQSFSNSSNNYTAGNVAVGYLALEFNNPTSTTTGVYNTAVGYKVMNLNTTGHENTAIGSTALYSNTTGINNTATGYSALYNNNGDYNTANGYQALVLNNVGLGNTAQGYQALFSNTDGVENTANGMSALYSNHLGFNNVAIGHSALQNNTNGHDNVAVGKLAGNDGPISSSNVAIVSFAHIATEVNNSIVIGYAAYTNTPFLALLGTPTTLYTGGYNSWSNFSDGRFKTNVDEDVKGLDFIMRLRPVTYHMDVRGIYNLWGISPYGKHNENAKETNDKLTASMITDMDDAISNKEAIRMSGFIAQEVEIAAKQSGYDFDGVIKPAHDKDHYRLAYAEFVVPLVKAVQEQQQIIGSQQKQIDDFENANEQLKTRLDKLEKLMGK